MFDEPPDNFATANDFAFPEPVYRREIMKLRHALTEFDRLSNDTQVWAAAADLRFIERESISRPGGLEVIGRINFLPPVENWWFRASDAFKNLREALDQLNHNIFRYVTGTEPGLIRFPMASKGSQWRAWQKEAHSSGYPAWLIARFKRFQPYSVNRPMLRTLETITNKEKHREGVKAALSLSQADLLDGQFHVSPMLEGEVDSSIFQIDTPPTIDLDSTEFLIATISIPGHTIEVAEKERQATFGFQFVLRVDGEEIPLEAAVQHITGEVLWATSHVIGREPRGTVMPDNVDLSLSTDA